MAAYRCPRCDPINIKETLWLTYLDLQIRFYHVSSTEYHEPTSQAVIRQLMQDSILLTNKINENHLQLDPSNFTSLHYNNNAFHNHLKFIILPLQF